MVRYLVALGVAVTAAGITLAAYAVVATYFFKVIL